MNNKFWKYTYIAIGALTLAIVTPLCIWSSGSTSSASIQMEEGTLLVDETARKEYLINEAFSTKGLIFKYNDKVVEPGEENVTYDFSSAGKKKVTISVIENNINYFANYYVEVFAVTTLDVSNYNNITIKSDGTVNAPDIKVIANLSGPANEFNKDPRFPGLNQTCFILDKCNYTITATKATNYDYYYNVKVQAGNATYGFIYSNAVAGYVDCASSDRIIEFHNSTLNDKKLTLYVTYNSNCYTGLGIGKNTDVEGMYVLRNTVGTVLGTYHFKYRVETWQSYFYSSTYGEGLSDHLGYGADGAALVAEVDGGTYYAPGTSWHKAVLG